jgi:16S rRNA (uracil1498-N3)-methyltransferase
MPTLKRFFLPESLCTEGIIPPETEWQIDEADTVKHLVQVKRLKSGQPLIAVNPKQQVAYTCTVMDVSKHAFTVGQITAVPQKEAVDSPKVSLYVGLLKEQAWDIVLQKACELGVHRIVPLWAAHSTLSHKQVNEAKLERWQRILKEASLQCESFTWPELHHPQHVNDALLHRLTDETGLLLLERSTSIPSFMTALTNESSPMVNSASNHIGLWVGPEGGWSPDEATLLQKHLQPVSLGTRILRAETACIAGVTLLMHGRG